MKTTLTMAAALTLLVACGNGDNNATNNTTASNNTTPNNTTANNTTANNTTTPNNTTSSNNMTTPNNVDVTPCGAVTEEGECNGTTLSYCDSMTGLETFDCVAELGDGSTCVIVPEYGADCTVPIGGQCELIDDEGDYFYLTCGGTDPACVWQGGEDVVCVDNFGACDEGTFVEICQGEIYAYDCLYGQAIAADCAALNGTCDATQGCIVPAGEPCDDLLTLCEAGTQCTIPDGEVMGTCE